MFCCCKEKIDSDLAYCTLLAGHDMGDPFEISTIRREVSMSVLLRYQCTPNDHHSLAPLYSRTFDANPNKVYIF